MIENPASSTMSSDRGKRRDRDPSDTADQLSASAVSAGGHVPSPVQANFLLCVLRVVRWYAGMRAFTCGTCILSAVGYYRGLARSTRKI